jgi:hypothetical protein
MKYIICLFSIVLVLFNTTLNMDSAESSGDTVILSDIKISYDSDSTINEETPDSEKSNESIKYSKDPLPSLPQELWWHIGTFLKPNDKARDFILIMCKIDRMKALEIIKEYLIYTGKKADILCDGEGQAQLKHIKTAWNLVNNHLCKIEEDIKNNNTKSLREYFEKELEIVKYNDKIAITLIDSKHIEYIAYCLIRFENVVKHIKYLNLNLISDRRSRALSLTDKFLMANYIACACLLEIAMISAFASTGTAQRSTCINDKEQSYLNSNPTFNYTSNQTNSWQEECMQEYTSNFAMLMTLGQFGAIFLAMIEAVIVTGFLCKEPNMGEMEKQFKEQYKDVYRRLRHYKNIIHRGRYDYYTSSNSESSEIV